MNIAISDIIIKDGRRSIDTDKAQKLSESMKEIGLINPVTITKDKVLIAGAHRIAAAELLGWENIECNIVDLAGLQAELAEIDENLIRNELHYIDRGNQLARRKTIYEELHPETQKGQSQAAGMNKSIGNNVSAESAVTFVADTAAKTGKSERVIHEDLQIAKDIIPEVQEVIRENDINKSDALKIARLEPEEQKKIAGKIISGEAQKAKSISAVIKAVEKQEKINQRLSEIKESPNIQLFNANCVEALSGLADDSVDMVLTDPPYAVDFKPSWSGGKWGEKLSADDTLILIDKACNELKRVCKNDAHLYFFTGWVMYPDFCVVISKHFDISNLIVWEKNNTSLVDFDKRYAFKHEFIIFAKQKGNGGRVLNNPQSPDVLHFDRVNNPSHSCEKPVDLLEYLVKNSTIEGETILDCFMGSGNTGVASTKNGRKYIGIEIEKDIFDSAKSNIYENRDSC